MKKVYYLIPILLLTLFSTSVVSVFSATPIVEQVTGGGWILGCGDVKRTFGFVAVELEDGTFKGNVQYVDHGTKLNVHGYDITSLIISGNEAWIEGTCRLNGDRTPRSFSVYVIDEDEPGKYDWFQIDIPSIPYFREAELGFSGDKGGGGNIQIHRPAL